MIRNASTGSIEPNMNLRSEHQTTIGCTCKNICFHSCSCRKKSSSETSSQSSENFNRHSSYLLHYKSINISDLSTVSVSQQRASQYQLTCLNCNRSFLLRTFETHAVVKVNRNSQSEYNQFHSFDESNLSSNQPRRKSLLDVFPIELRKFCTIGDQITESSDLNYPNFPDKSDSNLELTDKLNILDFSASQPIATVTLTDSILDDTLGAVFSPNIQPLVGPYTSSTILDWCENI